MSVIAIIGAVGGAGATTVAAHLSAAFRIQNRHSLAVDCCTENILRLHFGMPYDDAGGFARNLLDDVSWENAAYRSDGGQEFIPFGQLRNDQELESLCAMFQKNPNWLRNQLVNLQLPSNTVVVLDAPRFPLELRAQVLSAADLVLLVASPDAISYAAVNRIVSQVSHLSTPKTLMVLNEFDAARQLDRDMAVLLKSDYAGIFSPAVIHRDESVREALACKRTVFDYAPSSQSAYDFQALATWLLARLGKGGGVGTLAGVAT